MTTGKGVAGTGGKSGGDAAAQQEQHQKWYKLLQAYPPAQGWNSIKRDEIKTRFVRIGAQPSDKEKAFVENFEEWKKACDHFGAQTGDAEDGPTGSGTTGSSTGSSGAGSTGTTKKSRRELRQERRERRRNRK